MLIVFLCLIFSIFLLNPKKKNHEQKTKINRVTKSEVTKNDSVDNTIEAVSEKEKDDSIQNDDIVGRIKINGTNIDDYIVQSNDNDFYLSHNLNKEEDITGSIFLDYRNKFYDRKLLIFGHNARKIKAPFHDLEKYMDYEFYKKYPNINLELNGENSSWKIFSVMIVDKNDNTHMKITFNDEEWLKHLDLLKSNSIYDTGIKLSVNDRIIVLQTCNYDKENTYIIISAKKI